MPMIKNRKGETVVTNPKQNELLRKLYGSVHGRMLLKVLTSPVISKIGGAYMSSPFSRPLIKRFIKSSNIDTSQYIMHRFHSYNDFFTRKVRPEMRPIDTEPSHLISPCDSKLTVYKINRKSVFRIKDSYYRVSDMLANSFISRRYEGGYCLIFRLEVDDYHRYCYIDNGIKTGNVHISGELHTVNPIALGRYNIYKRNTREYTVLHTDNFGDVVHMEVGALMVGKIRNIHGECNIFRGQEKGMFMFGGSTIVLLFEKDRIVPDSDILRNSAEGYETIVKFGEKIGVRAKYRKE